LARHHAYPAGVTERRPEPIAKQIPFVHERPTGNVTDPFAWLLDRDDPDTIAYLDAENAYADAWFAEQPALIDELFGEIKSRVQETDTSAPVAVDDWFYVARTEDGRSYPIHCRGRSAEDATDQVLLDQNIEAEGHDYFDLGAFEVSPDHRLLAWSHDTNGDEHYLLRVRDLATGAELDDELADTTWAGVAWSSDGSHLFYVLADEQERPYRVLRHRLGTAQSDDVEVFVDHDERFYVGIGTTRSKHWIVIHSGSKTSSENWLLASDEPTGSPVCVRPRQDDVEYQVDHWGASLVVLTNLDAVDFRVMSATLDQPGDWTELLPHRPGTRITAIVSVNVLRLASSLPSRYHCRPSSPPPRGCTSAQTIPRSSNDRRATENQGGIEISYDP
jgi:oligopeptidase B